MTYNPDLPAKLLVVILNFNGLADTLDCLESLQAQSCANATTLVIDNGSRNDDLNQIIVRFPDVELIALDENQGWAGGNNVGLRFGLEREFDYILLLNNDTVLPANTIAEILTAARIIGEPCLLHPMIYDFDDETHSQLGDCFIEITESDTEGRRLQEHEIVQMDKAYGACMLIPAALVRRIGLLDERFFLQLEETDYFRRTVAIGFRSYCALRAGILHKESVSFGGRITPNKTYYQVRNSLLLAEKHDNVFGVLRLLRKLVWALRHQARAVQPSAASYGGFILWLCSGEPVAKAVRHGFVDYLRHRFGAR